MGSCGIGSAYWKANTCLPMWRKSHENCIPPCLSMNVSCRSNLRPPHHRRRAFPLNFSLRHEVARLIVWHVVTRPVVPSAVSYADVREGNDLYSACGHGTHSHATGTRTVRGRCICQHQAETGLDGW